VGRFGFGVRVAVGCRVGDRSAVGSRSTVAEGSGNDSLVTVLGADPNTAVATASVSGVMVGLVLMDGAPAAHPESRATPASVTIKVRKRRTVPLLRSSVHRWGVPVAHSIRAGQVSDDE